MTRRCTHYACRCDRALELAQQGLIFDALRVHDEAVTCRLAGDLPTVDAPAQVRREIP